MAVVARIASIVAFCQAVACTERPARVAVAVERVSLGPAGPSLDLPRGWEVLRDGPRLTVIEPGARTPHRLTLAPGGESAPGDATTIALADGAELRYRVRDLDGGGSGGDEAKLEGVLTANRETWSITCSHQAEWPARPEATWCIPYLRSLRSDRR